MFRQDAVDRDAIDDRVEIDEAFADVHAVDVWKQNIHLYLYENRSADGAMGYARFAIRPLSMKSSTRIPRRL